MSDRVDSVERHTPLTRREFTLEAALALLAGCVITVTDACSSSSTPAAPTPPAPSDVNGLVSANHNHVVVITGAQITAGNAVTLNMQGTATHPHTLSITQADLTALRNRQPVAKDSTTENNHFHTVTFTPV